MDIKNILVIRTHRLGDILQLTPMFQGLKIQYPSSKIFFLTGEEYLPLIAGNPCIDAVIPINEKECRHILRNKPQQYSRLFNDFYNLTGEMRKIGFDLIINRQYEFGAVLSYLIGAPKIVGGAYTPERGYFFADRPSQALFDLIRNNRRTNHRNLTDWACLIGGTENDFPRKIQFPISEVSLQKARTLLPDDCATNADFIAVQMGAAKSFRQWGRDNFLPVLQWLTKEQGKKIVLTGHDDEREDADFITGNLGPDSCLNLTGRTSLPVLAAVLSRCRMLLTPDTGTMHIATAVGTQVLALFYGSAYPWETGPYGPGHFVLWPDLDCAPCTDPSTCPFRHQCKKMLAPHIVTRALEVILDEKKPGTMRWQPPNHIELLATANNNGQQTLTRIEEKTNRPVTHPDFFPCRTVYEINPPMLLAQIDEIAGTLLDRQPEKAFTAVSDLFSNFSQYLAQNNKNHFSTKWTKVYNSISDALTNKDAVLLRDILQYDIEPAIQELKAASAMQ